MFIFLISIGNKVEGQNIIINGSFEDQGFIENAGNGRWRVFANSNEINGWYTGDTGDIYLLKTPFDGGPGYNPAKDGTIYVDLSGDGLPHTSIYQDIQTEIGAGYKLKFYIGSASYSPEESIETKITGSGIILNQNLRAIEPDPGLRWVEKIYDFIADSNITRISFKDISSSDDNGSFVDNVSVEKISIVPESNTFIPCLLVIFLIILYRVKKC